MDAVEDVGARAAYAPGADLVMHLRRRLRSSQELDRALAEGLARLAEAQLRFADELGLPRARVLSVAERFHGQQAQRVIADWLAHQEEGAPLLRTLLAELAAHQSALTEALDGALLDRASRALVDDPERERRLPLWLRVLRGVMPRRPEHEGDIRHLQLVAPAFVAAYLRARQPKAE